jgi:excisionase family DNA binding protein
MATTGWLTIEGAAKYASASRCTVSKWMKEGLRHARLNSNTVRIKIEDIDAWLDQRCQTSVEVSEQVTAAMAKARKKLKEMRLA